MLRGAVEEVSGDDGWASQGKVATLLRGRSSALNPRDYGYRKLGGLIVASGLFEVERRPDGAGNPAVVYLRDSATAPPSAGQSRERPGVRRHRTADRAASLPTCRGRA